MSTPVVSSYAVGTGQPIYAGKHRSGFPRGATLGAVAAAGFFGSNPSVFASGPTLGGVTASGTLEGFVPPTWWTAATVGQWYSISGTAGPGAGLNTNAFSDLTIDPVTSRIYALASGGHADGSSNAAAMVDLSANAPGWTTLRASSTPTENVLYYADGRPTSRHTYHHTHWIPSLGAVLLAGCRFGYGGGTPTGPGMDLFDVDAGDYLARYTWPDLTPWAGAGYGVVQDGANNIWTTSGYKINATTGVASKPGSGSLLRYPAAYDSIRDRIFALQCHDGEGFGTAGVQAVELNPNTGNSQAITFNSSAAFTQFTADAPQYAGMAYCPLDGKFYFMHYQRLGTLYVVTPNAGTVWDMTMQTASGVPASSSWALCKRMLWVPALSGFVLQYDQGATLRFLRMA